MLGILVNVNKESHTPHVSRVTTKGIFFAQTVFNEMNQETLATKLLAVDAKKATRKKKRRRKTRKAIAKNFVLPANAII